MSMVKGIARIFSICSVVFVVSSALLSCSGGSGGGDSATYAALGTLCGPRFDLTAGSSCPGNLCMSGLVQGTADDNIAGSYTFFSSDSMCTKACTSSSDCQGIAFTTANNVTVASEYWACVTTASGNYCAVSVTAPAGGGNICSGCGGVFCSGNCIGCPGC